MADWTSYRLGDVITLKRGYDLPHSVRSPGTFPVVSSSGITDYHAEAKVRGPGVVTGRYGTLGQVFYIESDFWPLNTSLYVQDFKGSDPRFVSYLLSTLELGQQNAAGAVPGVNRNHLHELNVRIPPLPIQRRIAGILSAYDELIENSQRRIKLLEAMARGLYREWFVHFRFPGHEGHPRAASPLGEIPEGWKYGKLGDVCRVIPGYAFKSSDWQSAGVPVVKIKNIQQDHTIDTENTDFVSDAVFQTTHSKFVLGHGDILIAMTGATAGKVGRLCAKDRLLLNQRVAKVLPDPAYQSLVWCTVSTEESQERFFRLADGAAQPNMSGSQIEGTDIICPPRNVAEAFSKLADPILNQTDTLHLQIQNLRRTRDLLLPRLLAGQVELS